MNHDASIMGKKKITQPTLIPSPSVSASTAGPRFDLDPGPSSSSFPLEPTVKAPPFWNEDPQLWFVRLEAMLDASRVFSQISRFNCLVQALSNEQMTKVAKVLSSPTPGSEYSELKCALLKAFSKTQAEKDSELFSVKDLGEEKAVDFVNRLDRLVTDIDQLKKAFLLLVIPEDVRSIAAAQSFETCQGLAETIDRIRDVKKLNQSVSLGVNAISKNRRSWKKKSGGIDSASGTAKDDPDDMACYYHKKYGPKARRCEKDCVFYSTFVPPAPGNANVPR